MQEAVAHLLPSLRPLGASPADGFDALVALCAGVAAGRKAPADALRAAGAAGVEEGCAESLIALFLEAARLGGAEGLAGALSAALPADRAQSIADIAAEGHRVIGSTLEAVSDGPDRLDYWPPPPHLSSSGEWESGASQL